MCGVNCVMFGVLNLAKHEVEGQRVIEFMQCKWRSARASAGNNQLGAR